MFWFLLIRLPCRVVVSSHRAVIILHLDLKVSPSLAVACQCGMRAARVKCKFSGDSSGKFMWIDNKYTHIRVYFWSFGFVYVIARTHSHTRSVFSVRSFLTVFFSLVTLHSNIWNVDFSLSLYLMRLLFFHAQDRLMFFGDTFHFLFMG